MSFKQDEIISSGYIFYTLGVTLILLMLLYCILLIFRKKLINRYSQCPENNTVFKSIKLSTNTTLYILDKCEYELLIVESSHNIAITHISKNTEKKQDNFNEI